MILVCHCALGFLLIHGDIRRKFVIGPLTTGNCILEIVYANGLLIMGCVLPLSIWDRLCYFSVSIYLANNVSILRLRRLEKGWEYAVPE